MTNLILLIRRCRLLFSVILLPIIQYNNFSFSFGNNIKDMSIAIKNDEVHHLDCQYFNVNGCITNETSNLTMSCVVLNYLTSLNRYKLVSRKLLNTFFFSYLPIYFYGMEKNVI